MTAIDACEPQIIRALEKDGWQIVAKPYQIAFDERTVFADFRARHVNEDGEHHIVVMEVKCFTNPKHDLVELYTAIGQYQLYLAALQTNKETSPLYLAVPNMAYQRFVSEPTLLNAFHITQVKMVIIDTVQEEVVLWLP